ncbi:MAG TPA: hypothetical protein VIV61_05970 [Candidatus Ozemobacteraceae bacterium]
MRSTRVAILIAAGVVLLGALALLGMRYQAVIHWQSGLGFVLMGLLLAAAIPGMMPSLRALREGAMPSGEPVRMEQALRVLQTLDMLVLGLGVLLMSVGIVSMFSHLDQLGLIGPDVATALTAPLYALILSRLILYPLQLRLRGVLGWKGASVTDDLLYNLFLLVFPATGYMSVLVVIFMIVSKEDVR